MFLVLKKRNLLACALLCCFFAGFAALEQGETEKKASPAQGETAFTAAYLCARGLMSL